MNKFYTVEAVPNDLDKFLIIGIFTYQHDAHEFGAEAQKSGRYLCVAPLLEHLEMAVIIDRLVSQRLGEMAGPLAKLVDILIANLTTTPQPDPTPAAANTASTSDATCAP